MKVAIVDYGIGNVLSIARAVESLGGKARISSLEEEIMAADALILPGVGAFGSAMSEIESRGLQQVIESFAKTGKPVMGICLGMQLLASKGTEFGVYKGLGLIPGCVTKIPTQENSTLFKTPNIGWYQINTTDSNSLIAQQISAMGKGACFYFVHSYQFAPDAKEHLLANYQLGNQSITAAVRSENIIGTQFHPEKSGLSGLRLLSCFLNIK